MARKPRCPACGAETFEAAERSELKLGGCVIFNDEPDKVCTGPDEHDLLNGEILVPFDLGEGGAD